MGCCNVSRLRSKTTIIKDYHDTKYETLAIPNKRKAHQMAQLYSINESFSLINTKLLKRNESKHCFSNKNKANINININVGLNNIESTSINEEINDLYLSLPLSKSHSFTELFKDTENELNTISSIQLNNSICSNANYFTINASCINGSMNTHYKSYTNNDDQIGLVYNKLNRPIGAFAIFIELFYLKVWKSELLLSIYNDINYVITIIIDDDIPNQIQIPLRKSLLDDTYIPNHLIEGFSTKSNKESVSILRYIAYDQNKLIHKIDIVLSNNCYETYIEISKEAIYFLINKESQLKKICNYQSIYSDYSNKKIANVHLEMIYAIDETKYYTLSDFDDIKNISSISTVPFIEYLYLNKSDDGESDNDDNCLLSNCKCSSSSNKGLLFNSIVDIKIIDFTDEFRQKISNDRLLDILPDINTKYELFEVIKRLSFQVSSFLQEKIILTTKTLIDLLINFYNNKALANDELLIGNIFKCLSNCFESCHIFNEKIDINDKVTNSKDQSLLLNEIIRSIEICFEYIDCSHQSILKNALMLLSKFIDDSKTILQISFQHNSTLYNNIQSFIYSLISNNTITNHLVDILTNNTQLHEIIVISIIKILILHSNQPNHSSINNISEELFVNISQQYINNSIIITDLLSLYCNYPSKVSIIQVNHLFDIYLKDNPLQAMHDKIILLTKAIINDNFKVKYVMNDYISNLILLWSKSLDAICSKLQSIEACKLRDKNIFTLLTYVYSIAKCINEINIKDYDTIVSIYSRYQICERLIKCLYIIILERDMIDDKSSNDFNSDVIKSKTILFRALYNAMKVIELVRLNLKNGLSKSNAQKMLMIMKRFQDKDNALNPERLRNTSINV